MTRTNLMAGTILASALATGAAAQTELSMWYHGAGNEVESEIINRIVSDFNGSQDEWEVSLQSFP